MIIWTCNHCKSPFMRYVGDSSEFQKIYTGNLVLKTTDWEPLGDNKPPKARQAPVCVCGEIPHTSIAYLHAE